MRCCPPAGGPPARLVVAAGVDEPLPLGVGDRHAADAERGQVDDVRRPLVVERPRLVVAVDAEHELAGRDEHRSRAATAPRRRQRRARPEQRRAVAQLVGGQHRLDVLLLVLLDHREREQLVDRSSRRNSSRSSTRPRTSREERAAPRAAEQRQADPLGPRVLERVVELLDLRRQHALRGRRRRRAAATGPPADRCARGPRPAGSSAGCAGGSARLVELGERQRPGRGPLRGPRASVCVRHRASSSRTASGPTRRGAVARARRRASGRPRPVRRRSRRRPSTRRAHASRRDVDAAARPPRASAGSASPSRAAAARRRGPARTARPRGRPRPGRRSGSTVSAASAGHQRSGSGVQAADLEVAAGADRREQRRQVVVEVGRASGRRPTAPRRCSQSRERHPLGSRARRRPLGRRGPASTGAFRA